MNINNFLLILILKSLTSTAATAKPTAANDTLAHNMIIPTIYTATEGKIYHITSLDSNWENG